MTLLLIGCSVSPTARPLSTATLAIGPDIPQLNAPGSASPLPPPVVTAPDTTAIASPLTSAGTGGGSAPAAEPTPAPVGLQACDDVAENGGVAATLAGGLYGFNDGPFLNAGFRSPRGLAIDSEGRLYVADTGNLAVRRLSADGQVETLAGGPDSTVFQEPHGIAVSPTGHVFVSDTARHAIYRIAPGGAVTLVAGGTLPGYADGPGAEAQFDDPRGLTLDAAGNLFVADMNNHCIRKISPTGEVTTFAGSLDAGAADGLAASARFMSPIGLTIRADGNMVVADIVAHTLRLVSPAGEVTTLTGSTLGHSDGQGASAQFAHPWAIAADARDTLFVIDGLQATRIRRVQPDGRVTTLAGTSTSGYRNGTGSEARFFSALGLAANSCGRLYLTDGFCRVREVR